MPSTLSRQRFALATLCVTAALAGTGAGLLAAGTSSSDRCPVAVAQVQATAPAHRPTLGLPIDHSVMERAPDDPYEPPGLSIGLFQP